MHKPTACTCTHVHFRAQARACAHAHTHASSKRAHMSTHVHPCRCRRAFACVVHAYVRRDTPTLFENVYYSMVYGKTWRIVYRMACGIEPDGHAMAYGRATLAISWRTAIPWPVARRWPMAIRCPMAIRWPMARRWPMACTELGRDNEELRCAFGRSSMCDALEDHRLVVLVHSL